MALTEWLFGAPGAAPYGACLSWRPSLIALHVAGDLIAALAFIAIPVGIVWFARRRQDLLRQHRMLAWWFGGLLFVASATEIVDIVAVWYPVFGLQALAKAGTAVAAVAVFAMMWPQLPDLVRMPTSQQLADFNRRLRREVAAHESTLRELEGAHRELETRVAERTKELSQVKARFETALRGAQVYLFSQDRDLATTWSYSPRGDDVLPSPDSEAVATIKRKVVESGVPEDIEASFAMPEGRVQFALHVDPTFAPDHKVDGIMCAAIDVTRIRSLESEQQRLTAELATALQRYETALRGSNVTVFTQDRELRYTSISNPLFGHAVADIVGRTDDDVIPTESRGAVVAMKREALDTGLPKDGEVRIIDGATVRWFDLHIEPLRDVSGAIVGLTCAAVDMTERKEGEAHLRLLMRELTHRSKNLLAVIQAMARQTARRVGTIDGFLEQFSARLQALARSHDLLVQEGWHGAALGDLVRSQLGHYLDRSDSQISQVSVEGPSVLLRPEAAQSLGLALHELATNAAKYGALSVPAGQVSIRWALQKSEDPPGLEINWVETGGPPVTVPEHHGFGRLVIERNLAGSLDAQVEMTFAAGGVRCRIFIPGPQLYGQ
jgi:PAS domain S-box-containing protein